MAHLYCPSCKKLIFTTDTTCPKCGQNIQQSPRRKFYHGKIFGLIAIVLILSAFILPKSVITVPIVAGIIATLLGFWLDENKWFAGIGIALYISFVMLQLKNPPIEQISDTVKEKPAALLSPLQLAAEKRHQDSVDSIRVNIEPIRKINETTRILNKTDYSSYNYRSAEDVLKIYNTLKYNTQVFEEYEKSKNPKVVAEAKKFRRLCEQKQKGIFPILRKAYVKVLKDALWEDDIDVKYSGTTISFIGGKFAANRNIAEFHGIARDALVKIRFKRVNYKWYKYDEEYSYYTLYSGSDSDPVR